MIFTLLDDIHDFGFNWHCFQTPAELGKTCDNFWFSPAAPHLFWVLAITIIIVFITCITFRYLKQKAASQTKQAEDQRAHENSLKAEAFNRELQLMEKQREYKEKDLQLKIKEFEELTIHQEILKKTLEKATDEKIKDLEATVKDLQSKFEKLDSDIIAVLIKKQE